MGNRANYEIGQLIDKVYLERLWTAWLGVEYPTFNDWSWAVLGRKERWARYMRTNYLRISSLNLADDTFARVMRVGWTKLSHILRVANSEVHLLQWIDRIEQEKLTEDEIRGEVAIALGADDPEDESASSPEASTGSSGSSGKSAGPAARASAGSHQRNNRRINYQLTFTNDDDLRVFVKAIKLVRQRINPEMSQGEAAALIATNYLGVAARDDEGGLAVELDSLIQCIEQGYRVRLTVAEQQPAPRQAPAAAADEPF